MRKLLLFILAVSLTASAQLQRYDNFAASTASSAGITSIVVVPNAAITVFLYPGVGVSCSGGGCTAATTYTSATGGTTCGTAVPLTRPTANACIGTADGQGNFGFWSFAGAYQYCVAAASFTTQCYNVVLGPSPANVNGSLIVGTVAYPNIAAATAAAGTSVTTITIPNTYAGTDCPAIQVASPPKILYLDYRGPNETTICNQGNVLFGASDAGVPYAGMRLMVQSATATAMQTPIYGQSIYNNATVAGIDGQDGLSGENDVTGTLTVSSGSLTMQGGELDNQIISTGGSILAAVGVIGYNNTRGGSTTPITNAIGGKFIGCNNIAGTGLITNCYGVFAQQETNGATRNYALEGSGPNLAGYGSNAGLAGWDVENSAGTAVHWLYCDSAVPQNCNTQAASTAGMAFKSSDAVTRASFTSTGWSFATTPVAYTETTAPAGIASAEVCYGDSTAQALKCNYHNTSFFNQTQTIGTGSVTTAGTAVNTLTCQAQTGITVTGAATTDNVLANIGAALPATWQTGIVLSAHVTASNTVTVYLCNPTATATITPVATQVNVRVLR